MGWPARRAMYGRSWRASPAAPPPYALLALLKLGRIAQAGALRQVLQVQLLFLIPLGCRAAHALRDAAL